MHREPGIGVVVELREKGDRNVMERIDLWLGRGNPGV